MLFITASDRKVIDVVETNTAREKMSATFEYFQKTAQNAYYKILFSFI